MVFTNNSENLENRNANVAEDELRVRTTVECQDAMHIPKVEGAGECFGENKKFQRMHNGVIIHRGSYHGEWMTRVIQELRGHHEPQEEKVFAEVLPYLHPGSVMVELGSFWAYYSLWFQRSIPNAVSIMVEPNPEKLEVGTEHFRLNDFEGTFIRGFVGDESLQNGVFTDWDGKKSNIPQISIDGLMRDYQLDSIDILHADVQGAEFDMLKGAIKALSNHKIKYFFISTHGHEHKRCKKFLIKHGFLIVAEHSVLQSFSGDGLIVARSPLTDGPSVVPISVRNVSITKQIKYELSGLKRRLLSIARNNQKT